MARGRMINRTTPTDARLVALCDDLGPWALVCHAYLLSFIDVNGNVRGDEHFLKSNLFVRYDSISASDCLKYVAGMVEHGLAIPYEVDGMPYLHFPKFRKNQVGLRVDRESPEWPVPEGFDEKAGELPEEYRRPSGDVPVSLPQKGREEKGREGKRSTGTTDYSEDFLFLWDAYPKRKGGNPKKPAYAAYKMRLKEGVTHDDLMRSVRGYERYVKSERLTGTRMVMQTQTFLGPNERWKDFIPEEQEESNGEFSDL